MTRLSLEDIFTICHEMYLGLRPAIESLAVRSIRADFERSAIGILEALGSRQEVEFFRAVYLFGMDRQKACQLSG